MLQNDHQSDQDLVQDIACGDHEAFGVLFDRLSPAIFKHCYALLLDQQKAEDAAQEVFIKLWNKAGSWKPDASVKTWLMKVARNHCLDVLRKKKNDLKKHEEFYKDHLITAAEKQEIKPDQALDHEQYEKIIKNALFSLPERQREAMTLVYYSEVPNAQAAQIMGLRTSAFDSLLARARRNLRSQLEDKQNALKGCYL